MRFGQMCIFVVGGIAAGCVSIGQSNYAGVSVGRAPYVAVQKPLPEGEDRIYLLAAIPGRVTIVRDCVLFERFDGTVVLPVFENGIVAGRDRHGSWVYDPFSDQYFRDRMEVIAGGGGSGETIAQLKRRHVLHKAVPERCKSAVTQDTVLFVNPGLETVISSK